MRARVSPDCMDDVNNSGSKYLDLASDNTSINTPGRGIDIRQGRGGGKDWRGGKKWRGGKGGRRGKGGREGRQKR